MLPVKKYSEAFKKQVVGEYETGQLNKDRKYGISGNSRVLEYAAENLKLCTIHRGCPLKNLQQQRIKELRVINIAPINLLNFSPLILLS